MKIVTEYRALEQKHYQQLIDWIRADPLNANKFIDVTGSCLADYYRAYKNKFAILGLLAQDLDHPDAAAMLIEYEEFSDLEQLMG